MKAARTFGQNAVDQFAPAYNPDGSPAGGWSGILLGPVPDARDVAIMASNMGFSARSYFSGWNVDGKHVPWVMSSQCSAGAWIQAHMELQAIAQPGDMFIFANSGHGGQYDTPLAYNGGTFMCFYDRVLHDTEHHDLLRRWPAGVFVLYILDTCFSGGMKGFLSMTRAAPDFIGCPPAAFTPMVRSDISAAIVEFCAAQRTETALDGPQNGAFTGCLGAVWDQARVARLPITYQDWFDGTAELMLTAFPNQHPKLNVLGAGADLLALTV